MHLGPDIQWEREFEVSLWKSACEEFSTEGWLPCRRLLPCVLSIYWSRKVRVGNRSCKITSIFRKSVVLWSHVKWRLFIKYLNGKLSQLNRFLNSDSIQIFRYSKNTLISAKVASYRWTFAFIAIVIIGSFQLKISSFSNSLYVVIILYHFHWLLRWIFF